MGHRDKLVVDASVVVKWYIPERDHAAALALREDYLDGDVDLFAPSLLPFEVINALRYSGDYDGDSLVAAAQSITDYGIELRSFADAGDIATTANELDIAIYDASYLALAATIDSPAYTADERLLEAVSNTEYADRATHLADYR